MTTVAYVPDPVKARESEYPTFQEQLNAIWDALDTMELDAVDIGTIASDMLADMKAINTKYPIV